MIICNYKLILCPVRDSNPRTLYEKGIMACVVQSQNFASLLPNQPGENRRGKKGRNMIKEPRLKKLNYENNRVFG